MTDWVQIIIEIVSLLVAVIVFILTSRGDKKAIEEQTYRDSVRATLTDFGELRRSNKNFSRDINLPADEESREKLIATYLADLERFSVGCNLGAYDIEVIEKMSGGMLISQYRNYFKPYIEKRRRMLAPKSPVVSQHLYMEVEKVIQKLCEIRNEEFEAVEVYPEDVRILERFLNMDIASSDEVFDTFRSLPDIVEAHGEGKQRYLFVPGSREDRCVIVAHADTAFDREYCDIRYENSLQLNDGVYCGTNCNASIGADDRSGCAMLWLLRKTGHSLLLLDGEERGQIGAHYLRDSNPDLFQEINSHSFMLQLDRRGNHDCRYYDIPVTEEFKEYIRRATGFEEITTKGGKTDICALCTHICGVNLSVGYYDEHKPSERLVIEEWKNTLEIVRQMLKKPLEHYAISSNSSSS